MSDKRKKREFFDDIFEVEDFGDIDGILDYIMERLGMDMSDMSKKSFISAFSMSNSQGEYDAPDELNNISFDDTEESEEFETHQIKIKDPSPFIDVFEVEDKIHVMAELPNVEKDEIELHVTVSSLEIKVSHSDNEYSEFVDLPDTVNPDAARATYINGILEVTMDKMEFRKSRIIPID